MSVKELGPYPHCDRGHELQQLSIDAFRVALPKDKFLFRDERTEDKGVDGSIELISNGSFLNLRGQCQVKGTDESRLNEDGSYSHTVKTTNLHYLLNGSCPIYVVWIAPRTELRFAWAREEAHRLYQENPNWMSQASVTLRFTHVLSAEKLQEIFDRIHREGRMHRETHDVLARATVAETLVVSINPTSLAVTNPHEIYDHLITSGLSLVGSGWAGEVLRLLPFLNPNQSAEPRIQLVWGYARITSGDYLGAAGHLARAMLAKERLSSVDQHFLATLRNGCDYFTGRIDFSEFIRTEKQLADNAPSEFALQHELETLRLQHLSSRDSSERPVLWQELRQTVDRVVGCTGASSAFKLQAKLARLYADAMETGAQYLHGLTRLIMWKEMGHQMATGYVLNELRRLFGLITPLMEESEVLLKEAARLMHPLLYAEALSTQATILIAHTATSRFFLASAKQELPPIPVSSVQQVRQRLDEAATIFARAGCLEGEVRAKLSLADWLEVCGQIAEAQTIAESVRGAALAMGYQKQLLRAEEHLSKNTEYQKLMSLLTVERDMDALMAEASDEHVKGFAVECLTVMNLPKERLPVVERECLSLRDIAREQLQWCRHIGLKQNLAHTLSPQTSYISDPDRLCVCTKFNYASNIRSPDWEVLIVAFKRAYCEACQAREPKVGGK